MSASRRTSDYCFEYFKKKVENYLPDLRKIGTAAAGARALAAAKEELSRLQAWNDVLEEIEQKMSNIPAGKDGITVYVTSLTEEQRDELSTLFGDLFNFCGFVEIQHQKAEVGGRYGAQDDEFLLHITAREWV
jgi:hypothetical protein